jgi:hypothetical protein
LHTEKKQNKRQSHENQNFAAFISTAPLKKAKRKFWNTHFVLPTLSKINQKQNKIDIII